MASEDVPRVAAMLVATCASAASSASEGSTEVLQQRQETPASDTAMAVQEVTPFPTCLARTPLRICKLVGGDKPFHDGGGLCSPGRWPRNRRELASGRNGEGCALVKNDELQKAVLKILSDWIEAQDLGIEGP